MHFAQFYLLMELEPAAVRVESTPNELRLLALTGNGFNEKSFTVIPTSDMAAASFAPIEKKTFDLSLDRSENLINGKSIRSQAKLIRSIHFADGGL